RSVPLIPFLDAHEPHADEIHEQRNERENTGVQKQLVHGSVTGGGNPCAGMIGRSGRAGQPVSETQSGSLGGVESSSVLRAARASKSRRSSSSFSCIRRSTPSRRGCISPRNSSTFGCACRTFSST